MKPVGNIFLQNLYIINPKNDPKSPKKGKNKDFSEISIKSRDFTAKVASFFVLDIFQESFNHLAVAFLEMWKRCEAGGGTFLNFSYFCKYSFLGINALILLDEMSKSDFQMIIS